MLAEKNFKCIQDCQFIGCKIVKVVYSPIFRVLISRVTISFLFVMSDEETADNLIKRNIILVKCCYICKCSGETGDHLLIHTVAASELWSFAFSVSRVQ